MIVAFSSDEARETHLVMFNIDHDLAPQPVAILPGRFNRFEGSDPSGRFVIVRVFSSFDSALFAVPVIADAPLGEPIQLTPFDDALEEVIAGALGQR